MDRGAWGGYSSWGSKESYTTDHACTRGDTLPFSKNFNKRGKKEHIFPVKFAQSCLTLRPHGLHSPCNSPGNTRVGSLSLLKMVKEGTVHLFHPFLVLYGCDQLLSHVRPSATLWTAAFQAPPSTGFSRQEYRSGMPAL